MKLPGWRITVLLFGTLVFSKSGVCCGRLLAQIRTLASHLQVPSLYLDVWLESQMMGQSLLALDVERFWELPLTDARLVVSWMHEEMTQRLAKKRSPLGKMMVPLHGTLYRMRKAILSKRPISYGDMYTFAYFFMNGMSATLPPVASTELTREVFEANDRLLWEYATWKRDPHDSVLRFLKLLFSRELRFPYQPVIPVPSGQLTYRQLLAIRAMFGHVLGLICMPCRVHGEWMGPYRFGLHDYQHASLLSVNDGLALESMVTPHLVYGFIRDQLAMEVIRRQHVSYVKHAELRKSIDVVLFYLAHEHRAGMGLNPEQLYEFLDGVMHQNQWSDFVGGMAKNNVIQYANLSQEHVRYALFWLLGFAKKYKKLWIKLRSASMEDNGLPLMLSPSDGF